MGIPGGGPAPGIASAIVSAFRLRRLHQLSPSPFLPRSHRLAASFPARETRLSVIAAGVLTRHGDLRPVLLSLLQSVSLWPQPDGFYSLCFLNTFVSRMCFINQKRRDLDTNLTKSAFGRKNVPGPELGQGKGHFASFPEIAAAEMER